MARSESKSKRNQLSKRRRQRGGSGGEFDPASVPLLQQKVRELEAAARALVRTMQDHPRDTPAYRDLHLRVLGLLATKRTLEGRIQLIPRLQQQQQGGGQCLGKSPGTPLAEDLRQVKRQLVEAQFVLTGQAPKTEAELDAEVQAELAQLERELAQTASLPLSPSLEAELAQLEREVLQS